MPKMEDSSLLSFSPEDEIEYKSVHPFAIASIVLGIASVFALLHTSLWILPIMAVALGVLARHRIAKNKNSSSGGGLAVTGILFGCFFVTCVSSKYFMHRQLIGKQARAFCDEWLDFVRDGELYQAYELTLYYESRRPPNSNLVSLYGPIPVIPEKPTESYGAQADFQTYWSNSPQRELVIYGRQPSSKLTLERIGAVFHEFVAHFGHKKDSVQLIYAFDYEENETPRSKRFTVVMCRRWRDVSDQHWWVESIATLDEPEADAN